MGDVLHAMPAVAALREKHPKWMIGWAIEPAWRELLQAESEVHDVAWKFSGRDLRSARSWTGGLRFLTRSGSGGRLL